MSELTPMLKQYLGIKSQYPDAILFFRLGDFYEMFYEDAIHASQILDIALTTRNKGEKEPVPLCGVPYHASRPYVAKLLGVGKKVAICEQVEDPKLAKGVVKREVVRVITPGMVLDESVLEASRPNYLVSLEGKKEFAFSYLDISTGEFRGGMLSSFEALLDEIVKCDPKEILIPKDWEPSLKKSVEKHLPMTSLTSFCGDGEPHDFESLEGSQILKQNSPLIFSAALRLWQYACYTQKAKPSHVKAILPYQVQDHLILDEAAQKHLELIQTTDQNKKGSLISLIDRTKTAMGARNLRRWLLNPLTDCIEIQKRQKAIQILVEEVVMRQTLQDLLKDICDLERLIGRVATGIANARDLVALGESLSLFPQIIALLEKCPKFLKKDISSLQNFELLVNRIQKTLVEDPPFSLREGGLIREEIHPELDELRKIRTHGKTFIATLEEKEKKETGINSLKVRFNRVFGYYIEITHTHREKAPPHYIRKQTLANAERFITPELKEYEEKVLGAEERIHQIEYRLFEDLRVEVAEWTVKIQKAASTLATLDTLCSLAAVASEKGWVCPEVNDDLQIHIEEGRHPVVEELSLERFVPNDLLLDANENRFLMITGPNMAGKSTVMRQTALIVILAQIGSFVPAKKAVLGCVDRIFTRVGAMDRLARGESTFMVEMVEAAHILKEATEKSLVIIDEIGRGTSTYDGVAIAWAVAECLAKKVRAKTLFATHYHELIELGETCDGMKNYNIAVKEWNDQIIFLRKLVPGGTSRSYGIEVAKLAGLPSVVITRAKEILGQWELHEDQKRSQVSKTNDQLSLFVPHPLQSFLEELKRIDLNNITPMQALEFLASLKQRFS